MSLTWPWALIALAAFPALMAYRWWTRRRRRRHALRLSSVALVRAALPGQSPWRRRIPLWLLATAFVILGVGAARPHTTVVAPSDRSAIVLAIDQSASMCSTDVTPNRLTAAEHAAVEFVKSQRDGTKIGLVVFSGIAVIRVPPTTDKNALIAAINELRTSRGTAIGLGILSAIDAIAQVNPDVAPTGVDLSASGPGAADDFEPDTVVLLTDGANTQGVDPVTAAQQAAARHVRIYTIGFGTTQPAPFVCGANQLGPGSFGGGGFGGGGFGGGFGGGGFGGGRGRAQTIDVDTLTKVATTTGGKYFEATDAKELSDTLQHLPASITLEHRKAEITVWFALVGALFAIAAIALTYWWNRPAMPRSTINDAARIGAAAPG
ncbi:MAG TPA: VWA domain-containing protein [Micromonosporaceae bacterium]|jgi:Ca-activated chloride channel family protein|nr:VWA domain-containing protein [Micromonosporaceae bacterium]